MMNGYTVKQEFYHSNNQFHSGFQYPYSTPVFYSYMNIGIDNSVNITKETALPKIDNLKIKKEKDMEVESEIKSDSSNNTSPVKKEYDGNFLTVNYEEYIIVCDMCDFQCKNHREMDVHRLSHGLKRIDAMSLNDTNMDPAIKIKKRYECDVCPYSAKTSQQLHSHKRSHSEEKAYSCNRCAYKCKYLSGLKYHKLSHSTKHFECNQCQFTCLTAALLRSHKRKHSNLAPFVCNLCSYRCKYPAGLKYHMLTHTKGKDISCDVCNYTCRTMNELKIHGRKHLPLTCEYCGFSCKSKKTMTLHKNSGCRLQNA